MAATETQTVGLNLEPGFADEALRAAAAGEKFAGGLDMVARSAAKAGSAVGQTIGQLATSTGAKSPWANAGALGEKPDKWTGNIYRAIGAYKKEQDAREAATKAKERDAARQKAIDAAQKGAGTVAGGAKMAIGAGLAGLGLSSAKGLFELAMGIRGMAQIQMLSARAAMQTRMLFRGVDSTPAVRAYDRFLRKFDSTSVAGAAMGGMFSRTFNGLFSLLDRNESKITTFAQGMVLGALYIENAYLKARIALLPVTDLLEEAGSAAGDWVEKATGVPPVAWAGAAAVTALGIAALGAAAPFVAAALAIGQVIDQIQKLRREWGEWKEGAHLIGEQLREDLGFESQRQRNARAALPGESESKGDAALAAERRRMYIEQHGYAPEAAPKAAPSAAPTGVATGQDLGKGVAQGLGSQQAAVEAAAGGLVTAADRKMREVSQTHSPSEMTKRFGRDLGAGVPIGMKQEQPAVQEAADRLVPQFRTSAGGAAVASPDGRRELHIYLHDEGIPAPARAAARATLLDELRGAARALGVSLVPA